MQRFQLQVRRLLITFPQVGPVPQGGTLEELMGFHLAYLPKLEYYVCCQENHMDGGIHYHLVLVFVDKLYTTDSRYFDWMFDKHGDIKPIKAGTKNMERAIAYVKKDDNYVEDGIPPVAPPKEATMVRLSKLILAGHSLAEINQLEHVAMVMHQGKVRQSIALTFLKEEPPLAPWVAPIYRAGLQVGDVHDQSMLLISNWLDENIRKPNRDSRSPHLWIWGPTKLGKSTLVRYLATMLKVFDPPTEGHDWMTGYSDDFDLVVFDDFHAEKTVGFLKKFLQGYPMKVSQKTLGPVSKRIHVPCIFTCNAPPDAVYANYSIDPLKKNDWDALISRLLVCPITRFFNLYP